MPLFLRTASGKWDGRERPVKLRSVDNAQRCACNRVQYRNVHSRGEIPKPTECQHKLSFAILFFWTKVDHHRRARHHAGPDGDTSPLS